MRFFMCMVPPFLTGQLSGRSARPDGQMLQGFKVAASRGVPTG